MFSITQIERFLKSMREWGNRIPRRAHIAIFLLFYLAGTMAVIGRYEFDLTALLRIGAYYAEQNDRWTPEGAIILTGDEAHGGNGYDGQIFYYYARTLWEPGEWPDGFQTAYRAPRLGYPLLVAPFSIFGSHSTVIGMVAIQLLLGVAGIFALWRLLDPSSRYLILFYVFSPFAFQSYLVMVSDGVMASLVLIGLTLFWRDNRSGTEGHPLEPLTPVRFVGAFVAFSLAVLAKESALFVLFPLGLYGLWKMDVRRIILMLSILLPAVLWQLYLREVHGLVPAGVLKIFLSPLDGVMGIVGETISSLLGFLQSPSTSAMKLLLKLSARWILLLMIPAALFATIYRKGVWRILPFGLATILVIMSVLIADYYYFWSVYENISRMFTLLVPIIILMKDRHPSADTGSFFGLLIALTVMVFLRTVILTPEFPYRNFHSLDNSQPTSDHSKQHKQRLLN